MLNVKKKKIPKTIKKKNKKYIECAKKDKKWYYKGNGPKELYAFYKANQQKLSINYTDNMVKNILLESTNHRCCICGKKIFDSVQNDGGVLTYSVEHIVPKSVNPKKILVWKNLIPTCKICNSNRKDKMIKYYLDPRKKRKVFKLFYCNYYGVLKIKINKYQGMIDLYKLNNEELVSERREFLYQLLNPNFIYLLKLENDNENSAIIFYDLYLNYRKKRQLNFDVMKKIEILNED